MFAVIYFVQICLSSSDLEKKIFCVYMRMCVCVCVDCVCIDCVCVCVLCVCVCESFGLSIDVHKLKQIAKASNGLF